MDQVGTKSFKGFHCHHQAEFDYSLDIRVSIYATMETPESVEMLDTVLVFW